jgi:hypothetical protein
MKANGRKYLLLENRDFVIYVYTQLSQCFVRMKKRWEET